MEKEYAKDYPIPFHNDVFFKYMLIGDDAGSALLRSRIIEEIYGLKVHETKVLNPELLPEAFFGKRAVLDLRSIDRKTTRLNSSTLVESRMPPSA